MTNLLATLIITITTNWIDVGEFHQSWPIHSRMKVMEGFRTTNTVAKIELGGKTHEIQIESVRGPSVGRGLCNEYLGRFEAWPTPPWETSPWFRREVWPYGKSIDITNGTVLPFLKEWMWCMTNGLVGTNSSTNYIVPQCICHTNITSTLLHIHDTKSCLYATNQKSGPAWISLPQPEPAPVQ